MTQVSRVVLTHDSLPAVANKAHGLMAQRGCEEDPALVASHVVDTIPKGLPGKGVTNLFAAYILLRAGGGN